MSSLFLSVGALTCMHVCVCVSLRVSECVRGCACGYGCMCMCARESGHMNMGEKEIDVGEFAL